MAISDFLAEQKKHDEKLRSSVELASVAAAKCAGAVAAANAAAASPQLSQSAQGSGGAVPAVSVSIFEKPGRPHVIQCNTQGGVQGTKVAVSTFFTKALEEKGLACEL